MDGWDVIPSCSARAQSSLAGTRTAIVDERSALRCFELAKSWCEASELDDADENVDVADTVDAALNNDVKRDDVDELDDSVEGRATKPYISLVQTAIGAATESKSGGEDDVADEPEALDDEGTGSSTEAEASSASVTGVARNDELGASSRRAFLTGSGDGFDWSLWELRAFFAAASSRFRLLFVFFAETVVGEAGTGEPRERDGDAGAEDRQDGRGERGEAGERQVGAGVSVAESSSSSAVRLRPQYGANKVPV